MGNNERDIVIVGGVRMSVPDCWYCGQNPRTCACKWFTLDQLRQRHRRALDEGELAQ